MPEADINPDDRSLIEWPKARALVPGLTAPSPDVVFGDIYLSWNQAGVYLATIAMDYYDPELLAFGETFPLGEAFHLDWGIDAGAGPQRLALYMVPPKAYLQDGTSHTRASLCRLTNGTCEPVPGAVAHYLGTETPRIVAEVAVPWRALGVDGPPAAGQLRMELEADVAERTDDLRVALQRLKDEIAERKRVELALRRSEELNRLAMQAGRTYAFEWNPATDEVRRSHNCADILGISDDATHDQWSRCIERVHPDYLKWDNNFWINCDRGGHGHGAADGNMAHVQALYGILDELRRRYPDLMIENVSGGGARLDFGMMAFTDTAWMDDRTAPASHVRHNLEGLTFAFPPAYLLSFLIDADGEPVAGAEDLPLLMRSRGAGILGLTYRTDTLDEGTAGLLKQQIAEYKTYRDIITQSNATLLSAQSPVDGNGWDVLQEVADDTRSALIFAFKGSPDDGRLIVRPRGLLPDAVYAVRSVDAGPLGDARGDLLMQDGIELAHNGGSRAHLLILTAR
jgi:PAS domain-containing protein